LIYHYKCEDGHETEAELAVDEEKPPTVRCLYETSGSTLCYKLARRVWGLGGFKI
jgi:hypothetical protein